MKLFRNRELPASGTQISGITIDSIVHVRSGDEFDHIFDIERDFILETNDGDIGVQFIPGGDSRGLDIVASLITRVISHAEVHMNGVLILRFEDGPIRSLKVEPLCDVEAWVYAHNQIVMPCPPGGDLPEIDEPWG
jgi:hypothetical protein